MRLAGELPLGGTGVGEAMAIVVSVVVGPRVGPRGQAKLDVLHQRRAPLLIDSTYFRPVAASPASYDAAPR
ncbi:hypothetical protein GCM10007242_08590 [Pigmentiphaga litoralis]|nr:hypothetical protein GCM10007242_08590 [Pigmentiphaga litoralis]